MRKGYIVDKGLMGSFKANYMALTQKQKKLEGNFGGWCLYRNNLFCQERDGCGNCMVKNTSDK